MSLSGHFWTIAPLVKHRLRPPSLPETNPWSVTVTHDVRGETRLDGLLQKPGGRSARARMLLLAIHGLGGSNLGHNVAPAARVADALGIACLRINLRGASGRGDDFYHAGLWQDINAVLSSDTLAEYTDIYLLGYSMGGHISLRYASEDVDPRVRAVAAICCPLDLDRSATGIDAPARWIYRQHVLKSLLRAAAPVVRRGELPVGMAEFQKISTLRQWDTRVVAPRFGFAGAEDYYAKESAGPRLTALKRPALLVAAENDPMILADDVRPSLRGASSRLDVRWTPHGGHVGFPARFDLGERAPLGLEHQVAAWLLRQ